MFFFKNSGHNTALACCILFYVLVENAIDPHAKSDIKPEYTYVQHIFIIGLRTEQGFF